MIEEAGGLGGEDVSIPIATLISAGIKTITGQAGAVYTVNQVLLNTGVRFAGEFTITKPTKLGRMFNVHTGYYTLEFDVI